MVSAPITSGMPSQRPLVLVHGLWDTPRLFNRLVRQLQEHQVPLLVPHLPHRLGAVSLTTLAEDLGQCIDDQWGPDLEIDLLGFSMGGLISRIWLQQQQGARRTARFLSVGSPQQGTITAQWVPHWLFAGIAEMKRGSPLLRALNADVSALNRVDCVSYFCRWDLMVVPGWQAVLPVGPKQALPVLTHQQLMSHPRALSVLITKLLTR